MHSKKLLLGSSISNQATKKLEEFIFTLPKERIFAEKIESKFLRNFHEDLFQNRARKQVIRNTSQSRKTNLNSDGFINSRTKLVNRGISQRTVYLIYLWTQYLTKGSLPFFSNRLMLRQDTKTPLERKILTGLKSVELLYIV